MVGVKEGSSDKLGTCSKCSVVDSGKRGWGERVSDCSDGGEVTTLHGCFEGWLLLDKPPGISSAGAVSAVKRLMRALGSRAKVGHAGTLDPFARGLLLIGIGRATKLMQYAMSQDKEYEFSVVWGECRDTDDCTGCVVESGARLPTVDEVMGVLEQFTGDIEQVPPIYSAIKVQGRRCYKMAREGLLNYADVVPNAELEQHDTVLVKPRGVKVEKLACIRQEVADGGVAVSSFTIRCSKGFYIRALARDMARAMGTLGFVSKLCRMKIGKFLLADAVNMQYITEPLGGVRHMLPAVQVSRRSLLGVDAVLDGWPSMAVSEEQATRLRDGVALPGGDLTAVLPDGGCVSAVESAGAFVKVYSRGRMAALVKGVGGLWKAEKVFVS